MAKCSSCGGPLPRNEIVCKYCGTRNSVDLQVDYHEVPGEERTCPICKIPMATINIQKDEPFLIEKCDSCHGLFFDPGELDALLDKEIGTVSEVNYQRLTELAENAARQPVVYRKCPVCEKMMNRDSFGKRSGVVVDRCKDHGVFLDATELRQLMDWKKAGGQTLHQEHQAKESTRKQQRLADTSSPNPVLFSEHTIYDRHELDIADLLIGLVGKIFR